MRLDVVLVERGLARSRNHAATLIDAERVIVAGKPARKPAGLDKTSRPTPPTLGQK